MQSINTIYWLSFFNLSSPLPIVWYARLSYFLIQHMWVERDGMLNHRILFFGRENRVIAKKKFSPLNNILVISGINIFLHGW